MTSTGKNRSLLTLSGIPSYSRAALSGSRRRSCSMSSTGKVGFIDSESLWKAR